MFPITDSSQTIVDCLVQAARRAGVTLRSNCGVESIERETDAGFTLFLTGEERIRCERLLLATGGCRVAAAGAVAVSVGHTLEPPVPSLFTFHVQDSWLRDLAGVSLPAVQASVPALKLSERGPLLLTHQGVSGPVILRLSAWGARVLHSVDYKFTLRLNWLPELEASEVSTRLAALRSAQSARLVVNQPVAPLPARLWEKLVLVSGIARETRWANLSKSAQHQLVEQLTRCEIQVSGKSLNRDEFVTCGGIPLNQIDFKKMESRCCPNLFFAGEVLDIDGLTGGFNFQAAWTTGWIAGRAMASPFGGEPHHHVEPGH